MCKEYKRSCLVADKAPTQWYLIWFLRNIITELFLGFIHRWRGLSISIGETYRRGRIALWGLNGLNWTPWVILNMVIRSQHIGRWVRGNRQSCWRAASYGTCWSPFTNLRATFWTFLNVPATRDGIGCLYLYKGKYAGDKGRGLYCRCWRALGLIFAFSNSPHEWKAFMMRIMRVPLAYVKS